MNNLINYLALQGLWLAAVAGASHGMRWAGPAALVLFALYQLQRHRRARGDATLMALALPLGASVDAALRASGWVRYSAAPPAPWPPLWILALWAGFALTFNHSLAWVMRQPWRAALFGATAGPLGYVLAAHGWQAVTLASPLPHALLALALGWAIALTLLSLATRRFAASAAAPWPTAGAAR
ncbi:DUF2878 domain-containing protein [Xanthomonas albilineans]|uniref:DUF2878 domain-containing protein n=1 Tax=Xanthomonas albilineans (strain GPE PC73 / CFBP 7063) TaxID=380358 RepID=D2U9M6_XANAP|nr:DUF2878 domain-containing protein [Xanthomonas albilineans]QHQ29215.1 hypothetical protein XaFJ1_GM002502 [Xanthomonas albilineans]CBA16978.1 conserved hypothetical protein [Xanthomonas albilineans GPE PC73]